MLILTWFFIFPTCYVNKELVNKVKCLIAWYEAKCVFFKFVLIVKYTKTFWEKNEYFWSNISYSYVTSQTWEKLFFLDFHRNCQTVLEVTHQRINWTSQLWNVDLTVNLKGLCLCSTLSVQMALVTLCLN